MVGKPQVEIANVINEHEIAQLLTVSITTAAFEQAGLTTVANLIAKMPRHAGHGALVLFARAIHVEIAQANHLTAGLRRYAPHIAIELQPYTAADEA